MTTLSSSSSSIRTLPRATVERLRNELLQAIAVQTARASEQAGDDIHLALKSQTSHVVVRLQAALDRMDEGTYGVCVSCSNAIAIERLEAVPYAPTCAHCASEQSRNRYSR